MPTFLNFVFFVLALTGVMKKTSSFILDSQTCPAYKPCTCTSSNMYCQSKMLIDMPKFYPSNITGSLMYLYLYNNQLTSIPADDFRNLTVSNNTKLNIQIYSNHLNSIATNAFRGIRDKQVYSLDLNNNDFTTIPSELGTLTNINQLRLAGNPLLYLNPITMHQLGKSLKILYINLNHIHGWPVEFNSLTSLELLYVHNLNTTHLDYDVFDVFANTLTELDILYSMLEKVPVAICNLHNLQKLTFANNKNIHVNRTLFEPCSRALTSVTVVYYAGNHLGYVPNVFEMFLSMTFLYLERNKLSYIHWDTIPSNASLENLFLDDNDLTRIPSAVGKLHSLQQLSLSVNKITSVEDPDLSYLSMLTQIVLDNNPLEYISPQAFANNQRLVFIYLRNTAISHLPTSIAGLTNLRTLYLMNCPIECDCDMSFFKSVDMAHIRIQGQCKSSTDEIKSYIINDLLKCP